MAVTFDPAARRIILDSVYVTAVELWSRWSDWVAVGENSKWLPAMRSTGGEPLSGGRVTPIYVFLQNGWRVRPMESSHLLTIDGNLDTDDGSPPVVNTLGDFNVSVQYTVPVLAQAIAVGGAVGLSPEQAAQLARIEKMLRNKQVTDPVDGTMKVYDDDGVTVLLTAYLVEDAAGTQPYRGQGAERRERLV